MSSASTDIPDPTTHAAQRRGSLLRAALTVDAGYVSRRGAVEPCAAVFVAALEAEGFTHVRVAEVARAAVDLDLDDLGDVLLSWRGERAHEAVVEVDEEGTEAAAASGGAMAGSHGPTVTVDRPFLFMIRDEPTGAVMFLGRVADPR